MPVIPSGGCECKTEIPTQPRSLLGGSSQLISVPGPSTPTVKDASMAFWEGMAAVHFNPANFPAPEDESFESSMIRAGLVNRLGRSVAEMCYNVTTEIEKMRIIDMNKQTAKAKMSETSAKPFQAMSQSVNKF